MYRKPALLLLLLLSATLAYAQSTPDPLARHTAPNALQPATAAPALTPQVQFLFDLEAKFQKATAAGGGPAFASFFADDAVALNNKQAARVGKANIAANTRWTPAELDLTWTPQGGEMAPGGDMGYTWGHYVARSKGKDGKPVIENGRYFTVWKKLADGSWKVAMDGGNEEPADCGCSLEDLATPKP